MNLDFNTLQRIAFTDVPHRMNNGMQFASASFGLQVYDDDTAKQYVVPHVLHFVTLPLLRFSALCCVRMTPYPVVSCRCLSCCARHLHAACKTVSLVVLLRYPPAACVCKLECEPVKVYALVVHFFSLTLFHSRNVT